MFNTTSCVLHLYLYIYGSYLLGPLETCLITKYKNYLNQGSTRLSIQIIFSNNDILLRHADYRYKRIPAMDKHQKKLTIQSRRNCCVPLKWKNHSIVVEFEILTAMVMKSSIFWDITPRSPFKDNRRFKKNMSHPSSRSKNNPA
jgi:hypothetical protein